MELIINECSYTVNFDEDNYVVLYTLRLLEIADLAINKYYNVVVTCNAEETKLVTGKQVVVKNGDVVKISIIEKPSNTRWCSKGSVN